MKRVVWFALLMLFLLCWTGCVSQRRQISEVPRVLVVIRGYESNDMPYMTDNELAVMISLLQDAGLEVRVTSLSNDPYKSETKTIAPDLLVRAVNVADFDAVVLPCLATGTSPASQEIVELVAEFHRQEKVITAQYGARYKLYAQGLIDVDQLSGSEVLQKRRIVTSGCCPYMARYSGCRDGTRELMERLIRTLTKGE